MLYYEGDKTLLHTRCAAVVGTRQMTDLGRDATEHAVTRLITAGFTVVSGLAHGVDTLAHVTCIRLGGKTIACVPGGLCDFYPPDNERLQRFLGEKHLLVARAPIHDDLNFLARNGVIESLCEFCVVPEVRQSKSGTVSTIRRFLTAGKRVFIVHGIDVLPKDIREHKLLRIL